MIAKYKVKSEEFDYDFFMSIKNTFKGKDIEISINDCDETAHLLQSPENNEILMKRIRDINENKNLLSFSYEDFQKII